MTDVRPSGAGSPAGDPDEATRALGARIRNLRTQRGMTLVQVASEAGLSHSFLSQVERGLERLSMNSLFRIARALGTTQQDLLTEEAADRGPGSFQVYRHSAASPVDAGSGPLAVLAQHRARFLPMVLEGVFEDDGVRWQHDEEEFVYVLEGELILRMGEEEILLGTGDATYYEGGISHAWRTPPGVTCRLLVVKEQQHHR